MPLSAADERPRLPPAAAAGGFQPHTGKTSAMRPAHARRDRVPSSVAASSNHQLPLCPACRPSRCWENLLSPPRCCASTRCASTKFCKSSCESSASLEVNNDQASGFSISWSVRARVCVRATRRPARASVPDVLASVRARACARLRASASASAASARGLVLACDRLRVLEKPWHPVDSSHSPQRQECLQRRAGHDPVGALQDSGFQPCHCVCHAARPTRFLQPLWPEEGGGELSRRRRFRRGRLRRLWHASWRAGKGDDGGRAPFDSAAADRELVE